MKTTIEYLDEIAQKFPRRNGSPASDYGLADLLEVSAQAISKYRKGHSRFDEAVALRVADLLQVDPAVVLLDTAAARAQSPEVRKVWERIARRVSTGALALCLTVCLSIADVPDTHASTVSAQQTQVLDAGEMYIMSNRLRAMMRRLRRAAARLLGWLGGLIAAPVLAR